MLPPYSAGTPGGIAFAKTIKTDGEDDLFAFRIAELNEKSKGFWKKLLKVSFIKARNTILFLKRIFPRQILVRKKRKSQNPILKVIIERRKS